MAMDFLDSIADFIDSTNIPAQLQAVDAASLFTNPWFLVPFILFVGYQIYRQSLTPLVITGVALGLWLFSGSSMAKNVIVNGQIQLGKVLPIAGVGIAAIGIIIYFLFMRSD